MLSTIATEIKDVSLSADGKEATFVLVTKHSGDIAVTLPATCLQKLQTTALPASSPTTTTPDRVGEQKPGGAETSDNISIFVPNKCAVLGDKQLERVIVVLNPRLPGQYGFALTAKAAAELSAALMKEANAITAHQKANTH